MPGDPRTRDELLEAMAQRACPLCVIVERIERRAVDMFLYDQVNDISRRDTLRASRGLCTTHTAMLAEGRSALGIAIVSRDILRAMTKELETASAPASFLSGLGGKTGARLADRIAPHAACPMCDERPRIEAPLIAGLLQNLSDPAFATAFDESAGLCRVHLEHSLRAADTRAATALATHQATIWRRLEAVLDEIIRKHDYRHQGEALTTAERDAWRRALALSSGWYTQEDNG